MNVNLYLSKAGKTVWNKPCVFTTRSGVFVAACIVATRWQQRITFCGIRLHQIISERMWNVFIWDSWGTDNTRQVSTQAVKAVCTYNHDVAVCNELMGNKISDLFMHSITNKSNSSYSDVELIICCRRTVWHIGSDLHGPLRWHPQISGQWSEKLN